MPRYNVKHNDKYAVYTSVSDGFITSFMTRDEWINWRKIEYGTSAEYDDEKDINFKTLEESFQSMLVYNDLEDVEQEAEEMGFIIKTKKSIEPDGTEYIELIEVTERT